MFVLRDLFGFMMKMLGSNIKPLSISIVKSMLDNIFSHIHPPFFINSIQIRQERLMEKWKIEKRINLYYFSVSLSVSHAGAAAGDDDDDDVWFTLKV